MKKKLDLFIEDWKYKPIISWTDLSRNYPWGSLILLGAGLSIAQAFQVYQINLILRAVILFRDVEHYGTSSATGTSSNNSGIGQL
jgi:hypothetical protein